MIKTTKYIAGQRRNLQLKRIILLLLFYPSLYVSAQIVDEPDLHLVPDTVNYNMQWMDKNGNNLLSITVNGACNLEKPPYDGHPTTIIAALKNDKHSLSIEYDEPYFEMRMILFVEKEISSFDIKGRNAVFIPFFYCGNADETLEVSYIIFYNNYKYLKQMKFHCSESGKCKLMDDVEKISDMPKLLRNKFIVELQKYNDTSDFYMD